jgi:hypothetical protein
LGLHPVFRLMGIGSYLPVSRLGRDADHSIRSSAAVNNRWNCTPAPPRYHHGIREDNFALIIIFDIVHVNPDCSLSLQYNSDFRNKVRKAGWSERNRSVEKIV